jgi:hypothetical protein
MDSGEDFWAVVGQAFKARELTRADLTALVDRGLTETRGSYRALLALFNLPESDYKKFHAFLYQQRCNLPVGALPSSAAAWREWPCVAVSRSKPDGIRIAKLRHPWRRESDC